MANHRLLAEITCNNCRQMIPMTARQLGTVGQCPGCGEVLAFPNTLNDLRQSMPIPMDVDVECPACRLANAVPPGTLSGQMQCTRCRTALPAAPPPDTNARVILHVDPDFPEAESGGFAYLIPRGLSGFFAPWFRQPRGAVLALVGVAGLEALFRFGGAYMYDYEGELLRPWIFAGLMAAGLLAMAVGTHLAATYARTVWALAEPYRTPDLSGCGPRRGRAEEAGPTLILAAWAAVYFGPSLLLSVDWKEGFNPTGTGALLALIGAALGALAFGHAGLLGMAEAVNVVAVVRRALRTPVMAAITALTAFCGTGIVLWAIGRTRANVLVAFRDGGEVKGVALQVLSWALLLSLPPMLARVGGLWVCLAGKAVRGPEKAIMLYGMDRGVKIAGTCLMLLALLLSANYFGTERELIVGLHEQARQEALVAEETRRRQEADIERQKQLAEVSRRVAQADAKASAGGELSREDRESVVTDQTVLEASALVRAAEKESTGIVMEMVEGEAVDKRNAAIRKALKLLETRRVQVLSETRDLPDGTSPRDLDLLMEKVVADVKDLTSMSPGDRRRRLEALRDQTLELVDAGEERRQRLSAPLGQEARWLIQELEKTVSAGARAGSGSGSGSGSGRAVGAIGGGGKKAVEDLKEEFADLLSVPDRVTPPPPEERRRRFDEFFAPVEKRWHIVEAAVETLGYLPVDALPALETLNPPPPAGMALMPTEAVWLQAADGGSRLARLPYADGVSTRLSERIIPSDPTTSRLVVTDTGYFVVDPESVASLDPSGAPRYLWPAPAGETLRYCVARDDLLLVASATRRYLLSANNPEPVVSFPSPPLERPVLGRGFVLTTVVDEDGGERREWVTRTGQHFPVPRGGLVWTASGFYNVTRFSASGDEPDRFGEVRRFLGPVIPVAGEAPFAAWLTYHDALNPEPRVPEVLRRAVLANDERLGAADNGDPVMPGGPHLWRFGDWLLGSFLRSEPMKGLLAPENARFLRDEQLAAAIRSSGASDAGEEKPEPAKIPDPRRFSSALSTFGFNLGTHRFWTADWSRAGMEALHDVDGGRLVLLARVENPLMARTISCVRLEDGEVLWSQTEITSHPFIVGETLYLNEYNRLDLGTGKSVALNATAAAATTAAAPRSGSGDSGERERSVTGSVGGIGYRREWLLPDDPAPKMAEPFAIGGSVLTMLDGLWVVPRNMEFARVASKGASFSVVFHAPDGKVSARARGDLRETGQLQIQREALARRTERFGRPADQVLERLQEDDPPTIFGWRRPTDEETEHFRNGTAPESLLPPAEETAEDPLKSVKPTPIGKNGRGSR